MSEYYLEITFTIFLVLILLCLNKRLWQNFCLIGKQIVVIIIHACSKLVPKSKNLIVFGGENGKGFRGNTKYIFLEMAKDPRLNCIWITKNPSVVKNLRERGYKAYMASSKKGILYQLRAKVIVHSHSVNDDFIKPLVGGAISFNAWHGVPIKKVWAANKNSFSYKIVNLKKGFRKFFGMMFIRTNQAKVNYVVSTSPTFTAIYPDTFLVSKENILELGQARNDVFFKETEEDKEIPEWIRNGKIITYMPTHRNFGKKDKDINSLIDFHRLNELCEKTGYKFLVKRHMYSKGETPKTFSNIIDISSEPYDPQMILKYTDILITDYSSAYADYLLLDRPVMFFCYDLNEYLSKSNGLYFNYFDVAPGPRAFTFEQFISGLKEVINNPESYREDRKRVLDMFYSKENQKPVTQKQVDFIYKHLLKM